MSGLRGVIRCVGVLVVVGMIAAACSSNSTTPTSTGIPKGQIKLGALLTLTGPDAAIGLAQETINSVLVDRLNASGGIDGHQVDLITLNDQGDPADAVSQAQVLVQDKVAGIIYAGTAATVNQTVPVFMKAKIPVVMLDPEDQWGDGNAYPYFFDNYPLNKPTMQYLVTFAKAKGVTKLGVIGDGSSFYQGLETDLVPAANAQHLPIVSTVSYSPTAVDVTTQIDQLKASGANGIALLAEGGLGSVYTALKQVGWSPIILTTAAANFVGYSSLGSLASKAYANCSVAVQPGQAVPSSIAALMTAVEAKTGVSPLGSSAVIYNDDFLIFKKAITAADSLNGTAIRNQIEQIKDQSFTSSQYKYTFSADHHDGWPAADIDMCSLTGFAQYDLSVISTP